jgi:hypothetical protein
MSDTNITLTLHNRQQGWALMKDALHPFLGQWLQAGKKVELVARLQKRSLAQNARLWAMLTDISRQVDWYGRKLTAEEWKHVFSASLKKQDVVPGLDGGFVVLGISTSKMTRAEMADMQELIAAFGTSKNVLFSEETYES